jgi:hypothetical protein
MFNTVVGSEGEENIFFFKLSLSFLNYYLSFGFLLTILLLPKAPYSKRDYNVSGSILEVKVPLL